MPPNASIETAISELLDRMTLTEKVGQLNQIPYHTIDHEELRAGGVGSILLATNPTAGNTQQDRVFASYLNEVQRVAVEETRLGIPLLIGRDVIHGHRTVAPIPIGQAATWDPELVQAVAADSAREARADGIHWTFTPMLDIARDPRWGRIAEGFGEDPYLCATLAVASVKGYQGDDLTNPESVLACAKHYIGYGAAEGGRDYNTTEISPSTLLNVYAPPFKAAVEAGVGSIMSAFHEIGGKPITGNRHILRTLLKERWGFEGLVVSDWGAVDELVQHGLAADRREAAHLAIEAGVDLDMVARVYLEHLRCLVEQGTVPIALVDDAVRRILRTKFRLGLFDNPFVDEAQAERVHLRSDHRERALEIATKSLVLLKNSSGVLPLAKDQGRFAIVGPLADAKGLLFGTWTLDGRGEDVVSIWDAVQQKSAKVRHLTLTDDAVSAARSCDIVVAVVGESAGRSGEDNCVSSLDLPPGQQEMLERIKALGKPLVVVVISGRPLALTWVLEHADAVLWIFHPGIAGGLAVADVLFGDSSPSGKLPATFPRSVGQVPIYYNHKATGRPNPPAGRYLDSSDQPLLPFGYGLSYTTFEYQDLAVDVNEHISVAVNVRNTGSRAGEEIVQLYVRDVAASITRPVKELKGFQRVQLAPGEQKTVSFRVRRDDLGFYDNQERFCIEPGRFNLWVGPDSASGLECSFELN